MNEKNKIKEVTTRISGILIFYVLFAFFTFFVARKLIQTELLYFKLQPYFSTDNNYIDFLKESRLGYISLISQFFLQYFYNPITGSVLLTLVLVAVSLEYRYIFINRISNYLPGIEILPAIVILSSLTNYTEAFNTLVLFGISGIYLLINRLFIRQNILLKVIYQVFAILSSFFIFGLLTAIAVVVGIILFEIIHSFKYIKLLLFSIYMGLLIMCMGIFSGFELSKAAFSEGFSSFRYALLPSFWHILISLVIISILVLIFRMKFLHNLFNKLPERFPKQWIFVLFIAILTGIFFESLFVNKKKYIVLVEYYADKQEWKKVLQFKNDLDINDRICRFHMNRALFHTGEMAEKLFSIPQDWGERALFLTNDGNRECTMNSSDLFFEMGFIKGSKYWACENQTFNPYSARTLKRLALCSMLLDEKVLAEKYLNILKKDKLNKEWASEYLDILTKNDTSALQLKLSSYPKCNSDSIFFVDNFNPNRDLISLLKSNNKNKMVFEYLMSYYLLKNQLGRFYHYLSYLNEFDYKKIPATYEEALIVYYYKTKTDFNNANYKVTQDGFNRFVKLNKLAYEYRNNQEEARKSLFPSFGDTYWYYVSYGNMTSSKRKIYKRDL